MKHAFDAALLAEIMQRNDWTLRPSFLDTSSLSPASFRFPSKGPVTNTMEPIEPTVEAVRYGGNLKDFQRQAAHAMGAGTVTLAPGEFRRLDRDD